MWYKLATNVWSRLEWNIFKQLMNRNAESYIIRRHFTKYLYFTSNKGGKKVNKGGYKLEPRLCISNVGKLLAERNKVYGHNLDSKMTPNPEEGFHGVTRCLTANCDKNLNQACIVQTLLGIWREFGATAMSTSIIAKNIYVSINDKDYYGFDIKV